MISLAHHSTGLVASGALHRPHRSGYFKRYPDILTEDDMATLLQ